MIHWWQERDIAASIRRREWREWLAAQAYDEEEDEAEAEDKNFPALEGNNPATYEDAVALREAEINQVD